MKPSLLSPFLLALGACSAGSSAIPCTFTPQDEGSTLIACPDGSTASLAGGQDGSSGKNGTDGLTPIEGEVEGVILITNRAQLELYQGVTKVTGMLVIMMGRGFHELSLPNLESVDGSLRVESTENEFTYDTEAGDMSLDFGSLRSVGSLDVTNLRGLRNLNAFKDLTSVGDIYVQDLPDLNNISALTSFTFAGNITFYDNDVLCAASVADLYTTLAANGWTGTGYQSGNLSCL